MRLQEIVLDVSGMNGADCERSVAAALTAVPGVQSVRVEYTEGRAVITADPEVAAPDMLRAAVSRAGYVPGEVWFAE